MNYRELGERVLKRWAGPNCSVSSIWIDDMAAALESENVTVPEPYPEGTIEVVVYVGAYKSPDGNIIAEAGVVDSYLLDGEVSAEAFDDDDTHRVRAIVPVFPVSVPTVRAEGEQVN